VRGCGGGYEGYAWRPTATSGRPLRRLFNLPDNEAAADFLAELAGARPALELGIG
jgi:hypothetical protein